VGILELVLGGLANKQGKFEDWLFKEIMEVAKDLPVDDKRSEVLLGSYKKLSSGFLDILNEENFSGWLRYVLENSIGMQQCGADVLTLVWDLTFDQVLKRKGEAYDYMSNYLVRLLEAGEVLSAISKLDNIRNILGESALIDIFLKLDSGQRGQINDLFESEKISANKKTIAGKVSGLTSPERAKNPVHNRPVTMELGKKYGLLVNSIVTGLLRTGFLALSGEVNPLTLPAIVFLFADIFSDSNRSFICPRCPLSSFKNISIKALSPKIFLILSNLLIADKTSPASNNLTR
jgi:hypothetical protein